jgi:tetratricopeptide (TPR) repeat protein
MPTTLTESISVYHDALESLPGAGSSAVLDVLIARDSIAKALENGAIATASEIDRLAGIDQKLKDSAVTINTLAGSKTLAGWRQSVHPLNGPWWWFLDERAAATEPHANPLWTIPAVLLFALSLSVIAETLTTLRSGGINGLTVFGTLLQTILTLFAGSAFLSSGREWLEKLFSQIGISRRFRGASRVWLALGVFILTLAIRILLPDAVARYRNSKGDDAFANKQNPQAVQNYEQAVALKPGYVKAHFSLAQAYDKANDYSKAIDAYERTIKFEPENYVAYNNLARLYILHKKDYKSALGRLDHLRNNLPKLPSNLQYYLFKNRGWANLELGYYRQAGEDLEWALSKRNGPAAHYLLGRVYDAQNRKDEARQQFDLFLEALQRDPAAAEEVEASWIADAQEQLRKGADK